MGVKLVGAKNSKRTEYFLMAAKKLRIPVDFVEWQKINGAVWQNDVVKLDPFGFKESVLSEMNGLLEGYRLQLEKLSAEDCRFLNSPEGILSVLDKGQCKKTLIKNNVSVTELLSDKVRTIEELHEIMEKQKVSSVFVKPVYSSGAAGVVAYRRFPGKNREVLYASCCLQKGTLFTTKTLYRLERREEIQPLLESVLSLGVIVERWHPKASFCGKSYDLRVVWQFGRMEYVLARQSKGPVTNLHLNNAPLAMERLGLSEQTMADVENVCGQAMKCFPQLSMAGIDVLLEKGTMKPYIIEINGQGDLIYQDIYDENRIYKRQIEMMQKMCSEVRNCK